MVQRHTVVIPTADGSGAEVYPLKEWGRQHPDMFPDGFDFVYGTSHSYRKALLQRQGWTKQESEAEYRLIAPGAEGSIGIVEDLLGEAEPVERGYDAPYFSLEYQLRDFLASNLSTIDFGEKGFAFMWTLPAGTALNIRLLSAQSTFWPSTMRAHSTYSSSSAGIVLTAPSGKLLATWDGSNRPSAGTKRCRGLLSPRTSAKI